MIIFIYCNTEGGGGQDRSKALQSSPSAEGKRFRRSGGLPPQARMALPGRWLFAMTWRVHCRRPAAGAKGGKGTVWFPCPLLTPPNPPLRRDSLRSRSETGVTGARFRASFSLYAAELP